MRVPEKVWFEEWRRPLTFYETAHIAHSAIGLPDLYLKRRWNYALEAYSAGEFATLAANHNDVMIRLGRLETEPDFYMRANGKELPFELTELLEEDRRRGDEYRNASGQIALFDPDESYQEFLRQIANALNKKARKQYTITRHILLYNNISICEDLRKKLHEIYTLTRSFADSFASIWIIHSKYAVQMWPRQKNGPLRSLS